MFRSCNIAVQSKELMQNRLNGRGDNLHVILAGNGQKVAVMRHLIEVVSDAVQIRFMLRYERIKQVHRLDTTLHKRVIIVGYRITYHGADGAIVCRLCLEHIPFRTAYSELDYLVFVSGIFHGH